MMRPVPPEERLRRLQEGHRAARAAGRQLGGLPPYGWRSERGQLVTDPQEQAVRWLILHLRREGWSFRTIVAELRELRIPSRSGMGWTLSALHRIDAGAREAGEVVG
jgi:DNA invertase Pin-like site-specific DNA recombinase